MAKTSPAPRRTSKPKLPKEVQVAVEAALDRKAIDLVVMDLRAAGAFTDYFIVCTGQNARQVQAIADAVETALKARTVRPSHVEGYARAEWVLVDYFDFIVHVFTPGARNFYALERLWGDAVRIEFGENGAVRAATKTARPS